MQQDVHALDSLRGILLQMGSDRIIDLDEIRRVRKQTEESIQAHDNGPLSAPVRLAVKGKDQIEFTIDGNVYSLTETVAKSWATNLRDAVRKSRIIGEPICSVCERHACRRVHPGQQWKRKTDGRIAIVMSVFGARIQLEQESGRISTITGLHRLCKRYCGPWE